MAFALHRSLGSFWNLTTQSKDAALQEAADGASAALGSTVIAERHGDGRPGSTGIAIYFPVPSLYSIQDNWGYTEVAARFAAESQWDEFLAFHSVGGTPPSFNRPKPGLLEQVNAGVRRFDCAGRCGNSLPGHRRSARRGA